MRMFPLVSTSSEVLIVVLIVRTVFLTKRNNFKNEKAQQIWVIDGLAKEAKLTVHDLF